VKNNLILLSLISVFAYSSQKEMTIRVENRHESATYVNGTQSYCECGRSPVLAMILFGRLDLYCEEHIPEIEVVRRLTPERLAEILRKD
jgi:hypothetical protein